MKSSFQAASFADIEYVDFFSFKDNAGTFIRIWLLLELYKAKRVPQIALIDKA